MTQAEANTKAKELYGPKAFAEINHFGKCDIKLDQSWSEGKKVYKIALLLGWGDTWEEAFEQAAKKYPNMTAPKIKPKQLELFDRPLTGEDAED